MRHDTVFCFYLIFTTIMLISPWIFFVVVRGLKGIPIHNSFTEKNPKETSYIMTAISNIVAAIMTHLFSTAVSYLAQKRIVHKGATISHVGILLPPSKIVHSPSPYFVKADMTFSSCWSRTSSFPYPLPPVLLHF